MRLWYRLCALEDNDAKMMVRSHLRVPFPAANFLIATLLFRAVRAEWGQWTEWTLCAEQDGTTASQTRFRSCTGSTLVECPGGMWTQARRCLNRRSGRTEISPPRKPNYPIAGYATAEWRPWSGWSDCSDLPGSNGVSSAIRTRWRECDTSACAASPVCVPCAGLAYQQESCQTVSQPTPSPINYDFRDSQLLPSTIGAELCEWTPWSAWSLCTATCGRAKRYRVRGCSCATRCPNGAPIENELCVDLPQCTTGYVRDQRYYGWPPWDVGNNSQVGMSRNSPCSYCPPMYSLPCYTCVNLLPPTG